MSSVFFRLTFEAESLGLHGKTCLSFYVRTGPRTQAQCVSLFRNRIPSWDCILLPFKPELIETSLLGWVPIPDPPSLLQSLFASLGPTPSAQQQHCFRTGSLRQPSPPEAEQSRQPFFPSQIKSTVGLWARGETAGEGQAPEPRLNTTPHSSTVRALIFIY